MSTSFQGALRAQYQPSSFALVLAGVVAAVRKVGEALKNRHDAMTLAQFDDRMLSDIGLTRSDLRDAYSEPLWRDPTNILASRAHERRSSPPGDHARRAVAGAGRDRRDATRTGAAALAGALRTLSWSHFLRKTGSHFSGKCSECSL